MVKRVFRAITAKVSGLERAAFWLSFFSMLSLILGFTRDRILTHNFGAGLELDIYYAAFKIPDLIFVTVASLVSISALVPLFARKETEGEKHLNDATNSIFTVFSVLIVFFCVLAYFIMPFLIPKVFAGLTTSAQTEILYLARMLLLSPFLLGFSNFFGAIVQYEKRFILYSISPLLYNLGIILGLLFGVEIYGIQAAAMGVLLGAFMHLSLQAAFIFFSDRRPKITFNIKWKDVKETAYLSVPRTFALSIVSFVGLFFATLAARMGEGSLSVFSLAFNLQSVPLSLIGVSFSLAAFPALAVSTARKEMDDVILRISTGLREIIFWSLPLTALIVVLRAHIVRVILGSGNFDWTDTRLTAAALALFVASAVFQSIQLFLSRSLYALGKTRWPLFANVIGGGVSVVLAYLGVNNIESLSPLLTLLGDWLKVSDLHPLVLILPLAYSVGSLIGSLLLFVALGQGLRGEIISRIRTSFIHALIGASVTGFGAYYALYLTDRFFDLDILWGVLGHGFIAGIIGLALGSASFYFLRTKEYRQIYSKTDT